LQRRESAKERVGGKGTRNKRKEGYRFYAQEASEFAAASLQAVSEVLGDGGQTGGEIGWRWPNHKWLKLEF